MVKINIFWMNKVLKCVKNLKCVNFGGFFFTFIAYYILYNISCTKHVTTDWFAFRVSLAQCSARLRLTRGSGQLGSAGSVRLYSGLDSAAHLELGSGLCSELDLVRLSSVSGLTSGEADKSADLLTSH